MRIHFPSVSLGAVAVSLILLSMSQAAPTLTQARVEYGPHPRDMVQVKQGTPYTVPPGKLFVLTGLGGADNLGYSQLSVDGASEAAVMATCSNGGGSTVASVPSGFTVPGGSTISVVTTSGGGQSRAWGYLANQ